MLTEKRLTRVYNNAEVISFNDDSKFVFFSDVHRGDNSMSDEFAHNQVIYYHALNHYYNNEYTYIEVGDGDELWEHAKFKFIRKAHSDVYYMLSKLYREKRLIMLYGNHNIALKHNHYVKRNLYTYYDEYLEETAELFPGIKIHEGIILKHEVTGQEIFVVHGHQGDLMNDQLWGIAMFMLRYFWRFMHIVGFRNPASPAKNSDKQHKIEKNYTKWSKIDEVILLCGHTHRPKFPRANEKNYFNTGCCVHPRGITGIEVSNGEIMLINWTTNSDADGRLYIKKKVVRGPEKISSFINKNIE